jgi:hypothetical protein
MSSEELRVKPSELSAFLLPDLSLIDGLLSQRGHDDKRAIRFVEELEKKIGKEFGLKRITCYRIFDESNFCFVNDDDNQPIQWDTEEEAKQFLNKSSNESFSLLEWESFEAKHAKSGLAQKINTIRGQYSFDESRGQRYQFVDKYAKNEIEFLKDADNVQNELFERWVKDYKEYKLKLGEWKIRDKSKRNDPKPVKPLAPVGKRGPSIREAKDYDLIKLIMRSFMPRYSIAYVKAQVLNRREEEKGRADLPRPPLNERKSARTGETVEVITPNSTLREAIQGMIDSGWRVDVVFNEKKTRPIGVVTQNTLASVLLGKGADVYDKQVSELGETWDNICVSPPILDMHASMDNVAALLGHHHEAVVFKWDHDDYAREDEIDEISEAIMPGWHIITHSDVTYYLTNILHPPT